MLPRMTNETTEQNKCSHELAGPHREALVTSQAGEASGNILPCGMLNTMMVPPCLTTLIRLTTGNKQQMK